MVQACYREERTDALKVSNFSSNWNEASWTEKSADSTQAPDGIKVGPSLSYFLEFLLGSSNQCYICDSDKGECSEESFGEEKTCSSDNGCIISKGKVQYSRFSPNSYL